MNWWRRLLGREPSPGASSAPSVTAAVIARYAERFDSAVTAGGHGVSSPLGAWLLLALVGPAATGEQGIVIESLLGTDVVDAAQRADSLLADPPAVVGAAAAVWARSQFLTAEAEVWLTDLPGPVEQGDVPDQASADEWARRHTHGLIDRFPIALDPLTALVLASALVTRVSWEEPFDVVASSEMGGPWPERVNSALSAPPRHERFLAASAAGDVAVHAARSTDGLLVVSVIAAPNVNAGAVLVAAHEVAAALVERDASARRSLFDLPLGDGHSWTIIERVVERPASGPDRVEYVRSLVLPAWDARSEHDLLSADVGFAEAAAVLERFADPAFAPFTFDARQVAMASYTRLGFEAAAVTAIGMRAGSAAPQRRTVTERLADIRFAHPYAVVAVVEPAASTTWAGVPVFSAWVADPSEA